MKPAPFEYIAPRSLRKAIQALAQAGDEGRILAGGQSLVPMMALRLARPKLLVDINRIQKLAYIRKRNGALYIGALTRQREVERSELVRSVCPLLYEAVPLIGHIHIRNRGTIGGTLAHADPAAELPGVAVALDAALVLEGPRGERMLRAEEFYLSHYATPLEAGEILKEVRFPPWPQRSGSSFLEVSRRHGDFALAGVAVRLSLDADSRLMDPRIAVIAVGATPQRIPKAEALVRGEMPEDRLFDEAASQVSKEIEPESDVHASAEYRRHVAGVLTRRALRLASERARAKPKGGEETFV